MDVLFAAIDRHIARKEGHFAEKEEAFTAKDGSPLSEWRVILRQKAGTARD
jgi:hypothetical protein